MARRDLETLRRDLETLSHPYKSKKEFDFVTLGGSVSQRKHLKHLQASARVLKRGASAPAQSYGGAPGGPGAGTRSAGLTSAAASSAVVLPCALESQGCHRTRKCTAYAYVIVVAQVIACFAGDSASDHEGSADDDGECEDDADKPSSSVIP